MNGASHTLPGIEYAIRAAHALCVDRSCAGAQLLLEDLLGVIPEDEAQYLPEWQDKAEALLLAQEWSVDQIERWKRGRR